MIEVVEFCVLCFVIIDFFFWLIRCKWVWVILMGTVRVQVSLCSHGGAGETLSAFWIGLRRAHFSQGLQRVEAGEGWCYAVRQRSEIGEVIKDLAIYSWSSLLRRFPSPPPNEFELCAPQCRLKHLYG